MVLIPMTEGSSASDCNHSHGNGFIVCVFSNPQGFWWWLGSIPAMPWCVKIERERESDKENDKESEEK
jgi:succinate-acetate transporter protein